MIIPGYCEKCRKIKNVRVNSSGMARLAMKQVVTGICSACQQAEDDKRRQRRKL